MDRARVTELHCIQPIENLPSILQNGILSHERAAAIQHRSVAATDVQALRSGKRTADGRPLHSYANLYFDARNPMMFRLKAKHADLCVLRIDPSVLDLLGAAVTDGNAASDYVRIEAAEDGLGFIDEELVYATYWTHPDQMVYWQRKRARCAEVLVPDSVSPTFIRGAYTCKDGRAACTQAASSIDITLNGRLFFCE